MDDPDLYLDELREYVEQYYGVSPSLSTLSRRLIEGGWPRLRKKIQRLSGQKDDAQRTDWQSEVNQINQFTANQLVFTDETAVSEKTLWRRFGRAAPGEPAVDTRDGRVSKRWSVLPTLTIDGFLDRIKIHHRSTDAQIFEEWLEGVVLPQKNQYPALRSVLVMDYQSVHR